VNPIPLLVRVAVYGGCALLFVGSLKGCHDSLVAKGDKQGEARERGVWVAKELRRSQDEAAERARLDHQKEDSDRETRRLQERAQAERAAADVAAGKLRSDLQAGRSSGLGGSPSSKCCSPAGIKSHKITAAKRCSYLSLRGSCMVEHTFDRDVTGTIQGGENA
jgi:hypothetical protein